MVNYMLLDQITLKLAMNLTVGKVNGFVNANVVIEFQYLALILHAYILPVADVLLNPLGKKILRIY